MSTVNAFGAWLPSGRAGSETDLGMAVRDEYFQGARVAGVVRSGLKWALGQSIEEGQPETASRLLAAFIDSFPISGMLDDARETWIRGPDSRALAVLSRAAELICMGEGLTALPGGPWPRPPEAWVRERAGTASAVQQEHEDDGADWIAETLGLRLVSGSPRALPKVARLAGEDLAGRRAELVSALVAEDVVAVELSTALPDDPESQLAMGEVRLEACAQRALESYGRAGLLVRDFHPFESLLHRAREGNAGESYSSVCRAALLPGTPRGLARGELCTTGWLLWDTPCSPVAVQPVAVELLRALDGQKKVPELASELELDPHVVAAILETLRQLGAVSDRGSDERPRS